MMKNFKKSGFTLMELLVYMAIVGIVVIIAGEAFSNSTKFRIRTDNMIKATQEAENVGTIFKTDVEQLGTKSSKEAGNAAGGANFGDSFGELHSSVYIDPDNPDSDSRDSSSFLLSQEENGFSNFTFRRLRYDELGHYEATEEIHWYVQNKVLKRTCKLIEKKSGLIVADDEVCVDVGRNPTPVDMATGIESFNVVAATPSVKTDKVQVFPCQNMMGSECAIPVNDFRLVSHQSEGSYISLRITNTSGILNEGGTGAVLSNFHSNYDTETETVVSEPSRKYSQAFAVKDETTGETNWKNLCSSYGRLTLEPNQEYEISFNVAFPNSEKDRSLLFVPGKDHMSVGFRNIATGDYPRAANGDKLVDDFMFFPPLSVHGSGKRVMRFHVRQKADNVCMAFTFACFTPLVSQGSVTIKNLKLNKVATSDYKFPPEVPTFEPEINKAEKKNVKAFKFDLQVSRGAKNGGKGETGHVSLIIPTPSNGPRD